MAHTSNPGQQIAPTSWQWHFICKREMDFGDKFPLQIASTFNEEGYPDDAEWNARNETPNRGDSYDYVIFEVNRVNIYLLMKKLKF
ncbi:DNA-directed RNA polymerases I, II, and III subunit RPABC3 [Tyrophagus putrescentiae]|nr:DNA-directed RNA polymerases I, II, and III subunit RPABC3 [Tyrophagus putrescentiae]